MFSVPDLVPQNGTAQYDENANQVMILSTGYSRESATQPDVMHCNCSSTLIRSKTGTWIVVDTMTPWHRTQMLDALSHKGLTPADIGYLVCTHGHSDHIGNNNLFVHAARHIVGTDVNNADAYTDHDFGVTSLPLVDGIEVIATPGHTLACVSVVVPFAGASGTETIIIAGDLFEKVEDIEDDALWIHAGSSDKVLQRRNRYEIAKRAQHIVPGHGPMFAVTDAMREKLRRDVEEHCLDFEDHN